MEIHVEKEEEKGRVYFDRTPMRGEGDRKLGMGG
jgi:hypothetical protein